MSAPRTLEELLAECTRMAPAGPRADAAGSPPCDGPPTPGDEPQGNPTIPKAFRWATLAAPELRMRLARPQAIAEAEAALPSRALLLHGPSGCGKTSLACALLRAWEARNPRRRAIFAPAWRLGMARVHHGLGLGEAPEVDRAMSARLLVLDDLGSERNTATNAVPDVVFARALAGLPTWVTTWMTHSAISQRYGDGIARRICEAGRVAVIRCGKDS
jgi:DNA replication protein DnaC